MHTVLEIVIEHYRKFMITKILQDEPPFKRVDKWFKNDQIEPFIDTLVPHIKELCQSQQILINNPNYGPLINVFKKLNLNPLTLPIFLNEYNHSQTWTY